MNERIASLEAELQNTADPQQRVNALNALSAELSFSNPERAIELASQARQLASGKEEVPLYQAGLAASLINLARAHNQRGEYVESMACLMEAQPHYEALNDESGLMWLFNEFGRLYYFFSDYPNALSYYYRVLQLAQKLGHANRHAASFHNIGLIYSSMGDYTRALETLQQGLAIARNAGDQWVEGFLLGSLAEVHYHLKEYEQALTYGLHSVELARRNGTPTLVHGTLLAVSWTYFDMGQFEQAQACLQEILQTAEASGDRRGLAEAGRALGEQANRRGDPGNARIFLEKALTLAISLGEKGLQANCHRALAESFQQLGIYQQALEHYQAFHELDKTIFNEKSDLRLKMLEVVHHLKSTRQEVEIYRLRTQMLQQQVEDQRRIQQALEHRADHDALTGLLNRRAFFEQSEKLLHSRRKPQLPLALLMIDLDHFKNINDLHGHTVGDRILASVAALLGKHLRQVDLIGRYGGEEFVVLMPGIKEKEAAMVAQRLCQTVAEHAVVVGDESIHVTFSIGLAAGSRQTPSLDDLVRHADQALYQAKQAGRNCVKIYSPA
ncbi:MAG: tetratricopeptide repeat-containing diguanylate cyclase [Anaerolineales bacterium]